MLASTAFIRMTCSVPGERTPPAARKSATASSTSLAAAVPLDKARSKLRPRSTEVIKLPKAFFSSP
eukprot:11923174-Alexandrium_andersonii.AAC.1